MIKIRGFDTTLFTIAFSLQNKTWTCKAENLGKRKGHSDIYKNSLGFFMIFINYKVIWGCGCLQQPSCHSGLKRWGGGVDLCLADISWMPLKGTMRQTGNAFVCAKTAFRKWSLMIKSKQNFGCRIGRPSSHTHKHTLKPTHPQTHTNAHTFTNTHQSPHIHKHTLKPTHHLVTTLFLLSTEMRTSPGLCWETGSQRHKKTWKKERKTGRGMKKEDKAKGGNTEW